MELKSLSNFSYSVCSWSMSSKEPEKINDTKVHIMWTIVAIKKTIDDFIAIFINKFSYILLPTAIGEDI